MAPVSTVRACIGLVDKWTAVYWNVNKKSGSRLLRAVDGDGTAMRQAS